MRPLSLVLDGFGSYRSTCELDLSDVADCVVVGDNGSGKSTLFKAMLWCLFGETGEAKADEIVNHDRDTATVELRVVDINGAEHTFRRSRGANKTTASVTGSGGTLNAVREVNAYAADMLGGDSSLVCSTVFAGQGDIGAFMAMPTTERRERLMQYTVRNLFDGAREKADEELNEATEALSAARREVDRLAAEAANTEDRRRELDDAQRATDAAQLALSEAEAVLNEAQETPDVSELTAELEDMDRRLKSAQSKLNQAQKQVEQARKVKEKYDAEHDATIEKSAELEEFLAEATKAEKAAVDAATVAKEAKAVAVAEAVDSKERIAKLRKGEAECWTCGQPFDNKSRDALISQEEQRIDTASEASAAARVASSKANDATLGVNEVSRRVETTKKTIHRMELAGAEAAETLKNVEPQMEALSETVESLSVGTGGLRKRLKEARGSVKGTAVEDAHRAVSKCRADLSRGEQRVGAVSAALENAAAAAAGLESAEASLVEAEAVAQSMSTVKSLLRSSGLPHRVLTESLDDLQTSINDVLGGLGVRMRFDAEIDPSRRNQQLGVLAAALSDEHERRYETLSGGEQTRVDLGVRVGLMRASGIKSRCLLVDEGLAALDVAGVTAFAELLRELTQGADLDSAYTITHSEQVMGAFTSQIKVTRGRGGTKAVLLN